MRHGGQLRECWATWRGLPYGDIYEEMLESFIIPHCKPEYDIEVDA